MGWHMNWISEWGAGRRAASRLHDAVIAQARHRAFYESAAVADRFEARLAHAVLHAGLVMRHLTPEGPAGRRLARRLLEALFSGFDHALREIATGDSKTTRRMREFAELYTGQVIALHAALGEAQPARRAALEAYFVRNGSMARPGLASPLARYVDAADKWLAALPVADRLSGKVSFPDPAGFLSDDTGVQERDLPLAP
jgi:hypothetical protein